MIRMRCALCLLAALATFSGAQAPSTLGLVLGQAAGGDGIEVVRMLPGLPAERAGLKVGDRVLGGPSGPFPSVDHARAAIYHAKAGAPFALRIARGDDVLDLEVQPVAYASVSKAMKPQKAPKQGDTVPALAYAQCDGPLPADWRKRVQVVVVYQAACPACHIQGFPLLKQLQEEFGDNPDAAILALHAPFEGMATHNTPAAGIRAVRKAGFTGPVLEDVRVDNNGWPEALRVLGVKGTPQALVIDQDGKLLLSALSPDAEAILKLTRKAVAAAARARKTASGQ